MRLKFAAGTGTVVLLGLLLISGSRKPDGCTVTLRLMDAETGETLPGLIRITDAGGKPVGIPRLLSRGTGLNARLPIARWSVLPKSTTLQLPRKKLILTAFSGLETETGTVEVDLTATTKKTVTIRLKRFHDASAKGFRSANTHLHLQKITREKCDRYLREVPQADGLDMLFVSYLERAVADREYTSNRYKRDDLKALSKSSGVILGNGEEHRHNFTGFGQGYGHVMFLNIKKLIQPVSIGPGIMKLGTDGIPLQRGITTAGMDGATVLWCHNNWGMEAVPNFLARRVDAQNIFDGGTHGSYKDSFYRYLNAGMRVPFSTGTDWFLYDFSRVYCDVRADLSVKSWLDALSAGRSYITNGPLLEFSVDGKPIGETIALRKPGTLAVKARALGRVNFGRIELIRNGKVIATRKTRKVGGHYEAELSTVLKIDGPCWLALRTPPPPVKDDPQLKTPVPKNEFGRDLFAHTSAIYVTVAGKSHFNRKVARQLLAEMRRNRETIFKRGKFQDAVERGRVLDVYTDGIAAMRKRLTRQ
ncbi:MAG: CehA/McbA family metallohydrolase [Planctomycetaceae bacterium]